MSESRAVPPLRIAVLGDFEGLHTRRWLEVFVERGHEVHAISFYAPRAEVPGVHLHVLSSKGTSFAPDTTPRSFTHTLPPGARAGLMYRLSSLPRALVPPTVQRLVHARRYMRAGLRRTLEEIQPDVFHAHYAVEHGFYGSLAGFHPYVISTWGSDLLVESRKPLGRLIAQRALRRADLVTANDASLARRAAQLGVPEDRIEVIHLGIDRLFLDVGEDSVNLRAPTHQPPTVISTRAHEPLYNLDLLLRAFAQARDVVPAAHLIVAGQGSRTAELQALAHALNLGGDVRFAGQQSPQQLAVLLAGAHVYASVPSSDSFALSNVEAMAAGAFPILSDLPSTKGWLEDGVGGLLVPAAHVEALAQALIRALTDEAMRGSAVAPNRAKVKASGLRERNMLLMERHYYRLAGHPQAGGGEAI